MEKDKVVEAVCADLQRRSIYGIQKYGNKLTRTDINLVQWFEHAYEECLDMANYLKRIIMEMKGELE